MPLKRIYRIHLNRDFDRIFEKGRTIHSPEISLKYIANDLNNCRIAVIISKKTAKKAALRNKFRRQIKEIIRPRLKLLSNLDLIFILKKPAIDLKYPELKILIENLVGKI